ncbi:hypothetical protein FRC19_009694 [Serendipita sp. 401]|nr:hypothetical protein FRC19_009694 [Serendipita sp. 401]KAG9052414.1 hypothetical protein FS842_009897 [Serendipita sp. 407]
MTTTIELKATQSKVHAVTVFQANRAEVVRLFNVNLKSGQNEVDISQLPSLLEEDSIRVDGVGAGATISEVVYHPPNYREAQKKHNEAVREMKKVKSVLRKQIKIHRTQEYVLEKYSGTVTGSYNSDSSKLAEYLEMYEEKQSEIDEKIRALEEKMDEIDEKIKKEGEVQSVDDEGKKRSTRITVIIQAEKDEEAEICLTYMVPNASWKPLYDLRAIIEPKRTSIVLYYRATVVQSTGEDWNEVQLTLSTASPQLGSTIPSLKPFWVGPITYQANPQVEYPSYNRPLSTPYEGYDAPLPSVIQLPGSSRATRTQTVRVGTPLAPANPAFVRVGGSSYMRQEESWDSDRRLTKLGIDDLRRERRSRSRSRSPSPTTLLDPVNTFLRLPESIPVEGSLSTSFVIEGLPTIPSDTDITSKTHKVSIAVADLTAELQWISVPKENPSVFLQAQVKNTSPYVFLPGKANIFLDDSFVAKSQLDQVSPNETFQISFGVDSQVKVTYHPRTKKARTEGGLLTARTLVTRYSQKITIRNARSTEIKRLLIRDRIPVASDQQIKIALIEPAGLEFAGRTNNVPAGKENTLNTPKQIQLANGLMVHWKPNEDDPNQASMTAAEAAKQGMVEWVCEMGAGQRMDVMLSWEVTVPAGLEWGPRNF